MSNDIYKFGIIKRIRRQVGNKYLVSNIGICLCGQHIIGKNRWSTGFECNKCGNTYFVDATGQSHERFSIPYIEVLRRDNRGFKVKRINLSILYNESVGVSVVKQNLVRTMEYDIVDEVLRVFRNDELEYDYNIHGDGYTLHKINQYFFRQLDVNMFIDVISNEVTRGIYNVAKSLSNMGWNKNDNFIIGLSKLMKNYKWVQILANAGVPEVNRFFTTSNYHRDKVIDNSKTKPHEILKVPKWMMRYIREDLSIDRYVLGQLQGHLKGIDNNKFREIMAIVKDESTMRELANSIETVMTLHIDYEYSNIKKLILYLFREVRLTQGIESANSASTYLRDYIRMSKAMELDYEKYPKSLKKVHDVVQMNYNLVNDKNDKQKEFQLAVEKKSYQELAYANKKFKFTIITPSEPEDLIREGNQLSHCVASYVKDVANDKCKILFLREVENIDKPLATIEVRGLNIRQARGFANHQLNVEQREFIKQWAEEKNLVEAYY